MQRLKSNNMASFSTIEDVPEALLSTIDTLGFTAMSEIQEKAINPILEGRDILAQSKTGSGKTLAFGLPCVMRTNTNDF